MNRLKPVIIASFSPTSLACIRSWGKRGLDVGLICIQKKGEPPPLSKYLSKWVSLEPNALFTKKGALFIEKFLTSFGATGIISVDEKIGCWLHELIPKTCSLWISSKEVLLRSLDKLYQINVAEKIGFSMLPTYNFGPHSDKWPKVDKNHFPLCLRPSTPGAVLPHFKIQFVKNEKELHIFLKGLVEIKAQIFAQPFSALPNLVVHGSRSLDGKLLGLEAFLVEMKLEGVTLSITPFNLSSELRQKCIEFTNKIGLTGPFHLEFLYDPEQHHYYFLEINPRLGGTTAKVYKLGYDEPAYALKAYGVDVGRIKYRPQNITVSSKQALLKYILRAFVNKLTPLDYPDTSKLKRIFIALWGLFTYKDQIWDWTDLEGSMALNLGNIKRHLKIPTLTSNQGK